MFKECIFTRKLYKLSYKYSSNVYKCLLYILYFYNNDDKFANYMTNNT